MEETLKRAAAHRGAAFVEILQNCNIYNDLAWNLVYDRESRIMHELRVEQGQALTFGPAGDRHGLVLDGVRPRVVRVAETPPERLWAHDQTDIGAALILASLPSPEFPIPTGVLAAVAAPVYEEILQEQEQRAIADRGAGDIGRLLTSGDTWRIS
jgi:2-oxoglutarate ferredoxin oxidoreductase subunit beta